MKVNIAGIDKADLLVALYNAARPVGLGYLEYDSKPMTRETALEVMEAGDDITQRLTGTDIWFSRSTCRFDYVKGRPLKIDISGDEMETSGYDRDQGEGLAVSIVASLREAMKSPT